MLSMRSVLGSALTLTLAISSCGSSRPAHETVIAELNHPRGLAVMSTGLICVAEAGAVLDDRGERDGPTATLADTGALTCGDASGRSTLLEGLPYIVYNGSGVSTGPADVVEMDGDLFLLTGEGLGDVSRKILRVGAAGETPEIVADFLDFVTVKSPAAFTEDFDVGPSNPYAMVADPANQHFLVTDGATGRVLSANLDGRIEVLSEVLGHEVLTGITWGPDRDLYVASFSQLPHPSQGGAIVRVALEGSSEVVAADLTTPIDVAFDSMGRMYVLEFMGSSDLGDPYGGSAGRLLRLREEDDGLWSIDKVVLNGLWYPTALRIDDADHAVISVRGAFSEPGSGSVVRLELD